MTLDTVIMPYWEILRASRVDSLGMIPYIVLPEQFDPRPAKEQINDRYAHGGGWTPIPKMTFNRVAKTGHYPGDPPFHANAMLQVNEKERFFVFDYAIVLIDRGLEDYEFSRMD